MSSDSEVRGVSVRVLEVAEVGDSGREAVGLMRRK
jgi:hypothetical protein